MGGLSRVYPVSCNHRGDPQKLLSRFFKGFKRPLGFLDSNLGGGSLSPISLQEDVCGAVEELLQDDDEEPELPGREGLSVVNNVVFVEDSQFYKSLSNTSIFVECLPHALHNSMKDFCRSPVIANKYKKCLDCVKFFGHSFFNSIHRRGRFLDFMKNFKKCHVRTRKRRNSSTFWWRGSPFTPRTCAAFSASGQS
eukprot:PhM_4_TR18664/c1_g4_i2/m.19764